MESQIEKHEQKGEVGIILQALESVSVRICTHDTVQDYLKKALNLTYFILGFSPPTQFDYNAMIEELCKQVISSLPTMRVAEFEIAVRKGCNKQYGEFMGISVATLMKWFFDYTQDLKRMEALKEKNKPVEEPKKEPTPDEIRIQFISRLKDLFSAFKKRKNLSIQECTFYFKQLWRERIIVFEPEITKELKERALKEVLGNIDFTKANDINESKKMREHYQSIIENQDTDNKVLNYAKYLGLIKWFEMLEETGQNINDLIDN